MFVENYIYFRIICNYDAKKCNNPLSVSKTSEQYQWKYIFERSKVNAILKRIWKVWYAINSQCSLETIIFQKKYLCE